MSESKARFGLEPDDLAKVGVEPGIVQPWEDGMRTDGGPGTYEWWYADAHFDDGSSIVITFYTKSMMTSNLPLSPQITFNFIRADGFSIRRALHFDAPDFTAGTDNADVRIGENFFRGDLASYSVHVAFDDVIADLTLHRRSPSWRLGNGFSYYGNQDENWMGWFPAVPAGDAQLKLTTNGTVQSYSGRGYHDHNWGNVPELHILHHWYWGRMSIDQYAVISYDMTASEAYGYQHLPMFMLAKNGAVVADDPGKVRVELADRYVDEKTGKPVHSTLIYTYGDLYRITYRQEETIEAMRMLDALEDPKLRESVKANGFDGAYLRFTGSVTIEELQNGEVVQSSSGKGLWELMYFGKPID